MRVFVFVTFLFAFLVAPTASQANGLAGSWKGTWTKDGDALPVTLTFARTDDAYSGTFDSDALEVSGIPLSDVSDTNGSVHFEIKGDQSMSVFDGAITGDVISGT